MFFAGEEGGNALAEVLAGKVNPSGKLSLTIPRNTGQLPMCLIHRPNGREGSVAEYLSISDKLSYDFYNPLYPFGFGLSYTTYKYGEIKLLKKEFSSNEDIPIEIDVTNTGKRNGDEVVQLYLTDLICRISQSTKQMKAFQRVSIAAGETKTVEFILKKTDLSFLNEKLQPEVEPGEFEIMIGSNCMNGVTKRFIVK